MSINKKLNEDYFETKRKYKKKYNSKLTLTKAIRNLIITFFFISLFKIIRDKLHERIEQNKKQDIENMERDSIMKLKKNNSSTIVNVPN